MNDRAMKNKAMKDKATKDKVMKDRIVSNLKAIWLVFVDNISRLKGNIVAIVIIAGLIILPSLYAWFSLMAFWNPDQNTGDLTVAIADNDEGYSSTLIPTRVDAGARVVDELRTNDQFHWVFVDEKDAVDGVASGKYYAAFVIPKTFSADLMTIFSDHIEHASIAYYVNDKENPIAPHVTSQGASKLQEKIDQTFTDTVTDIALESTSDIAQFMDESGLITYTQTLIKQLEAASDDLDAAAAEARLFASLLDQCKTLVSASSSAFGISHDAADGIKTGISDANSGLESTGSGLNNLTSLATQAVSSAKQAVGNVKQAADSQLTAMENDPAAAKDLIASLTNDLNETKSIYAEVRNAIAQTDPNSPTVITIDHMLISMDALESTLQQASDQIDTAGADIAAARSDINAAASDATEALDSTQSVYADELKSQARQLSDKLQSLCNDSGTLADKLKQTADSLEGVSASLTDTIDSALSSLNDTAAVLEESSASLNTACDDLTRALSSADLDEIHRIIGNNPAILANALSAATKISEHPIYEMPDYGSAMSPFYTSLALFIGSIFLVIILNVTIIPKKRKGLSDPSPAQIYLGNLLFFLMIAFAQALLVCAGNIWFLGIQCNNIVLYFLTGLTAAFVFCNVAYALSVAFGEIGKAIVVILLVMQVAGSGGELPIQLSAPFFQAVYPWLPFTHSMAAFQGAMTGIYGDQFTVAILCLLAFTIPALLLGLVARRPIMRLTDYINAQLEKTQVL